MVWLNSIVKNLGEIQAVGMKLGDFSWNLLQIKFLAKRNNIRACSVAMLTDLLKVLFGSLFFIYIFCCILIFIALYVLIIKQGDIISSYRTDMINSA